MHVSVSIPKTPGWAFDGKTAATPSVGEMPSWHELHRQIALAAIAHAQQALSARRKSWSSALNPHQDGIGKLAAGPSRQGGTTEF
jgi:hypothetical protein